MLFFINFSFLEILNIVEPLAPIEYHSSEKALILQQVAMKPERPFNPDGVLLKDHSTNNMIRKIRLSKYSI